MQLGFIPLKKYRYKIKAKLKVLPVLVPVPSQKKVVPVNNGNFYRYRTLMMFSKSEVLYLDCLYFSHDQI